MEDVTYTQTSEPKKVEKKKPKFNFIGCNNCHKTNITLIKATDSYYCIECFNLLKKQKYKKRG